MLKTSISLEACCGCGACSQVCPFAAITVYRDDDGFLRPRVNLDKCKDCSACAKVCPINSKSQKNLIFRCAEFALALSHKNKSTAWESSSGGAFTVLAEAFAGKENCAFFGAEAIGVFDVSHRCVSDLSEINVFRKSKYIPSDTLETFKEVKAILKSGGRVLYSGAPCQIAALKLFIGEKLSEKLFTVDFSCHGVGSVSSLKKYISDIEKRSGKKILKFAFRAKSRRIFTYSSQSSKITFDDGEEQIHFKDSWFKGFVAALYKNSACADCPFSRPERVSDATIADFWGIERISKKWDSGKGVSLLLLNSQKAKSLLSIIKSIANCESFPFEEALKYNIPLREKVKKNPNANLFKKLLETNDFESALNKVLGKPTLLNRCVSLFLGCFPIRIQYAITRSTKIFTSNIKAILCSILPSFIFAIIMKNWASINGRKYRKDN